MPPATDPARPGQASPRSKASAAPPGRRQRAGVAEVSPRPCLAVGIADRAAEIDAAGEQFPAALDALPGG